MNTRIVAEHHTPSGTAGLRVETESLEAVLLPEIGSKLASLRSKRSGHEYLWQPPDGRYPIPHYGATYEAGFATGFDECFPTIMPCAYPDQPWRSIQVPDHGEVWALPWRWRAKDHGLDLWVDGRGLPYRLHKWLVIEDGDTLAFIYRLDNPSRYPLRYLWSAHPLFNVREDTLLEIQGAPWMQVFESAGDALGPAGERYTWPVAQIGGERISLAHPGQRATPAADKLFLGGLTLGQVIIQHESLGEGVSLGFSLESIPYLGLWYNLRGWPESLPHYNVGVEPCTAPTDLLPQAGSVLGPGESREWWMRLRMLRAW